MLRDGLPIFDPAGHGHVDGSLLCFATSHEAGQAYERIADLEPDKQYRWDIGRVNGLDANVLIGISPNKGSVHMEQAQWNGWTDPLFTSALDVVEETLTAHQGFDWDLKSFFRLQMAYLLLWSSIERYVSLRYHLKDRATEKVGHLADEPGFGAALYKHVARTDRVYRADRPKESYNLHHKMPADSVDYYYQIRSNITHRGKASTRDHDRILMSLTELLPIFREVLKTAQMDAQVTSKPAA